jgi:hypothetical protein
LVAGTFGNKVIRPLIENTPDDGRQTMPLR